MNLFVTCVCDLYDFVWLMCKYCDLGYIEMSCDLLYVYIVVYVHEFVISDIYV